MSTLLVDELYPGVQFDQAFRIDRDITITHIRPWIYLHNTLQDGDLKCTIFDGATELKSIELAYTEINNAKTLAYAHGHLRLDLDAVDLKLGEGNTVKEYTLRFEMINHTKDTGNFLGICRRWDDKTYPTYGAGVVDGDAPNDSIEPAGYEIFEYILA